MLHLSNRLVTLLDEQGVEFEVIHHNRDWSAERAAADTHTPGRCFAKPVVLIADGRPVIGICNGFQVLTEMGLLNLSKAAAVLSAREVQLAPESLLEQLFPDSELGAEPPFGNLYDMPVYVSPMLAADEDITFNGGSHEEAVRLPYRIYHDLVHPKLADVAL